MLIKKFAIKDGLKLIRTIRYDGHKPIGTICEFHKCRFGNRFNNSLICKHCNKIRYIASVSELLLRIYTYIPENDHKEKSNT